MFNRLLWILTGQKTENYEKANQVKEGIFTTIHIGRSISAIVIAILFITVGATINGELDKCNKSVTGTVTGSSSVFNIQMVDINYEIDGEEYNESTLASMKPHYRKGDEIKLKYNDDTPSVVVVKGDVNIFSVSGAVVGGIGAIILVVSGIAIIKNIIPLFSLVGNKNETSDED